MERVNDSSTTGGDSAHQRHMRTVSDVIRWKSHNGMGKRRGGRPVTSVKARRMLGWTPKGRTLMDEIENGCYRDDAG